MTPLERIRAARANFARWVAPKGVEVFDADGVVTLRARQDEEGREIPDPRPMEVPSGMKVPETMAERLMRLMRNDPRFAQNYLGAGDDVESFEEADDFDVGDDIDPVSPFEEHFDPALGRSVTPAEILEDHRGPRRFAKATEERMARMAPKKSSEPSAPAAPAAEKPDPGPKTT